MGHQYVKEPEVFNTTRNGTVPKPSAQDVTDGKYLKADGTWDTPSGGGGGAVTSVNGQTGAVVLDADDVGALPDDTPLFSGDYNDLTNKPTIPDALSDLSDDSTHRVVTDTEKSTWNGKSDFSGSYNDLTDKPTIPAAQVNSDWNAVSGVAQILNKPTIPSTATQISYDHTASELSATNVQTAVNEVDDNISAILNVYGSKNLAKAGYSSGGLNSVTWTALADGTVTASGTVQSYSLDDSESFVLKAGTYIISGRPSADKAYIAVKDKATDVTIKSITTVESDTFTLGSDTEVFVRCGCNNGFSEATAVTYKPMIRDASISDDTYVPYAKTNSALTQDKAEKTDLTSIIATGSTNTTGAQIPNGAYFYLNGVFCRAIEDIASNASFTKDTNYVEKEIGNDLSAIRTGYVTTNGSVTLPLLTGIVAVTRSTEYSLSLVSYGKVNFIHSSSSISITANSNSVTISNTYGYSVFYVIIGITKSGIYN